MNVSTLKTGLPIFLALLFSTTAPLLGQSLTATGNSKLITPRLEVTSTENGRPIGGGAIVIGPEDDRQLALGPGSITARLNGEGATLVLNNEGGFVTVGDQSGGTGHFRAPIIDATARIRTPLIQVTERVQAPVVQAFETTITPILQITGGSDFSEMFDVRSEQKIEPGMLVVIDAKNPGSLMLSSKVNDRRVAGIISGAGGVKTGMTMGQKGSIADGKYPVALTGRVYCFADASTSAIEPGDMLTTSSTIGHAMKVEDPNSAAGAMIGKAMTGLKQGEKGLVLVLVNLQ